MKVLVATGRTQGQLQGDYHWAVEGELVTAVTAECCEPARCGCGRGFPGLASSKATTTAMVVEMAHVDEAMLRTAVFDSLRRQGWLQWLDETEQEDLLDDHLDAIEQICAEHPVGSVVRRNGPTVWALPIAA